jgi:ACS family hexuronate transporter-like MFS transporter
VNEANRAERYRWAVLGVFVLSTAINYLDRQTLSALAPIIKGEMALTNAQFGLIITAFSVTYAISAPFAGMLIDRIGLNRAISLAVALWSCAGIATGFTRSLTGLVACRAVLGIAEAGGIPAAGKAIHQYLRSGERAVGNAVNQAGVSLGGIAAPALATWIAVHSGWRQAFIVTGVLGLAWIPLWNWIARGPGRQPSQQVRALGLPYTEMLRDSRLWAFVAANALSMILYSLWTNWITLYLVDVHHLTTVQAAWYAWIPPAFAMAGGFTGGWASLHFVNRGVAPRAARFRVCLVCAVLALSTAIVPMASTAGAATAIVSLSIFAVSAFSVNMYTLPLDTFGGTRAAFAVSMLVASYGAVQALASYVIGVVVDAHGYAPVTTVGALMPLAACAVLWLSRATRN